MELRWSWVGQLGSGARGGERRSGARIHTPSWDEDGPFPTLFGGKDPIFIESVTPINLDGAPGKMSLWSAIPAAKIYELKRTALFCYEEFGHVTEK